MKAVNFKNRQLLFAIVMIAALISGCKGRKPKIIKSPSHYNFSEVQTIKLDLRLKEISGIAWDGDRDEFLAHYDEAGKLFVLDKSTNAIVKEYPVGGKEDYEDIALYNGVPYMLISSGKIMKVIRDSAGVRAVEAGKLPITGTNDFETLYADTSRKALIMVCKNCQMDNKSQVSAFAFYPDSSIGFDVNPVFRMNADTIKKIGETMAGHKTSKFQPSAAAIHPILKKLFIISSASNQLVIADLNGKAEKVFELGKKLFPQPEGLTFKRNGDMYISNEGVTSKATIHRFVYKL
jgi:uncharacterized protein YjiK